ATACGSGGWCTCSARCRCGRGGGGRTGHCRRRGDPRRRLRFADAAPDTGAHGQDPAQARQACEGVSLQDVQAQGRRHPRMIATKSIVCTVLLCGLLVGCGSATGFEVTVEGQGLGPVNELTMTLTQTDDPTRTADHDFPTRGRMLPI